MRKSPILLLVAIFAFCFMAGCDEDMRIGAEKVIESSHSGKPGWFLNKPESDKKYYYFIGEDTSLTSAGVRDAYQVALSRISYYISTEVKAVYKQVANALDIETANQLKESFIQNVSQSAFSRAKEKEIYWEKIARNTLQGVEYYYRVYSLVRIPKESLEKSAEETMDTQIKKAQSEKNEKVYSELKKIESEMKNVFTE